MKAKMGLILLMAILGTTLRGNAQTSATATATVSATIISAISITKMQDMNFGTITAAGQGSVTLSPITNNRQTSGNVETNNGGTVSLATFVVSGNTGASFTISLPASPITISNGESTMTVSDFVSSPPLTATLPDGTQKVSVGATLHIGDNQPVGLYKSTTPFQVTVNYN